MMSTALSEPLDAACDVTLGTEADLPDAKGYDKSFELFNEVSD